MTVCPYDPLSPEQLRDPYPAWAQRPPVFYDEQLGLWSVTGYDEVLAVLRDTATFSSADAFALRGFPRPRMLVAKDPPEHTQLRKRMQRAFTPRRVTELEPFIVATCHELAEALRADLMAEYANALPLRVITKILGFEASEGPELRQWTEDFLVLATPAAGSEDGGDPARIARMRAVMARTHALIEARRVDPRDDVISVLAAPDLDHEDVVTLALELVIAGNDTTANLIAHMVAFLLEDRARWERVRADRSLVPVAVEETLRRRGSSKGLFRRATRDVVVGGAEIAAGDIVHVLFAAANHDPARFPAPRDFDLDRPKQDHLAFGRWTHFCLGAPLARLEARVALDVLLDRHPGLRAVPDQPLDYAPTLTTQTLEKFLVEVR
ncbi:cytochrome P450 [Solirubrobacter ginsenosidimutans]|uniref:Cytochrome P450 n=1 Tax=Solirubrobacter ginsenosidimutans TaxID=490573 RepID=A0A9X3S5Y4_9ACTN|nr:cytochrome P450 [Solirubrobacter ginsenosidimutans]MDA0162133.1 cytochrome P450 [Solirubrobacter ginsenosidimutans]